MNLFEHLDHRPWPLPDRPWIMKQQWLNLLFLHWPVDPSSIQSQIPEGLEIDTFDGNAWIGIVPFDMKGVTPRGCPAPSILSDFPEINVRTYVVRDGKPGVWFFSLDVTNPVATTIARKVFHLPYYTSDVRIRTNQDGTHYFMQRDKLVFDATYHATGPCKSKSGSFEDWCTERYCLYAQSTSGKLFRAQVHHRKWPLEKAKLKIRQNTLLDEFDVGGRHPSILFSKSIDVVVFPMERLRMGI